MMTLYKTIDGVDVYTYSATVNGPVTGPTTTTVTGTSGGMTLYKTIDGVEVYTYTGTTTGTDDVTVPIGGTDDVTVPSGGSGGCTVCTKLKELNPLTTLPQFPNSCNGRDDFFLKLELFFKALPTFQTELNTLINRLKG
jgi:hypothetical protein